MECIWSTHLLHLLKGKKEFFKKKLPKLNARLISLKKRKERGLECKGIRLKLKKLKFWLVKSVDII